MTGNEFEEQYARKSGVSVEWLHEQGQRAVPCDCGDNLCLGWQMINILEIIQYRKKLDE